MFDLIRACFGAALGFFRTRQNLMLENLALRQQLVVLKRKHPKPRLGLLDKLFWVDASPTLVRLEKVPLSGRS